MYLSIYISIYIEREECKGSDGVNTESCESDS